MTLTTLVSLPGRVISAVLVGLIRLYQLVLSPALGSSCRFEPCCSQYGLDAVRRHGALRGLFLTIWRIMRCNPWNNGGYDPVPLRRCRGGCFHSHD